VNPKVERRMVLRALEKYGDPAIPMHLALFSMPLYVAWRFGISLVVWGENSAFEYGTTDEALTGFRLDSRWLRSYGVSGGTVPEDWLEEGFSEADLAPYARPSDGELEAADLRAVFLGYYFPWDPEMSLRAAEARGFRRRAEGPKTGIYDFADIDDDLISVHHFLKWYKFGFTRSFDNLSLEIRNGRMTRPEAVERLRALGGETPREDIGTLCEFLRISTARFFEICEGFRNRSVWKRNGDRWVIPDFPIPDWPW
jgi:hypothetical protein